MPDRTHSYSVEHKFRNASDFDDLQDRLQLHPLSRRHLSPDQASRLAAVYAEDGTLRAMAVGVAGDAVVATFGKRAVLFHDFLAMDDPEAAQLVIDDLRSWARDLGANRMYGPMSVDLSALRGVRLGDNDVTTALGLPDNPGYFSTLLERCGLTKVQDLHSFRIETGDNPRVAKLAEYVMTKHPDFTIRNFETKNIEREISHVVRIYNDAWSDHWGFIPLTEDGLLQAFEGLRPFFNEHLAFFAMIDGKEHGVGIGIPNPMPLDPQNPVNSVRGMLFGVSKEFQKRGVDALLIHNALTVCKANGFDEAEIGWVLESNASWLNQIRRVFREQIIGENCFRIYQAEC